MMILVLGIVVSPSNVDYLYAIAAALTPFLKD